MVDINFHGYRWLWDPTTQNTVADWHWHTRACGRSAIWQAGSKILFSCRAPWHKACPHIQLVPGESCRGTHYSDAPLPFSTAWGESGSSRQEPCLPWPPEPATSQVQTLRPIPNTRISSQKCTRKRNILLLLLRPSSVHKQTHVNNSTKWDASLKLNIYFSRLYCHVVQWFSNFFCQAKKKVGPPPNTNSHVMGQVNIY